VAGGNESRIEIPYVLECNLTVAKVFALHPPPGRMTQLGAATFLRTVSACAGGATVKASKQTGILYVAFPLSTGTHGGLGTPAMDLLCNLSKLAACVGTWFGP
jgi:hypothetical protein